MFQRVPFSKLPEDESPLPPLFPQLFTPPNNTISLSRESTEPKGYHALATLFCLSNGTLKSDLSSAIVAVSGTRLTSLALRNKSAQRRLLNLLGEVFSKEIDRNISLSKVRLILTNATGFDFDKLSKVINDTIETNSSLKHKNKHNFLRNAVVLLGIIRLYSETWPQFQLYYGIEFSKLCLHLRRHYNSENSPQELQNQSRKRKKAPPAQNDKKARQSVGTPTPNTQPFSNDKDTLARENFNQKLLVMSAEMIKNLPCSSTSHLSAMTSLFYPIPLPPTHLDCSLNLYPISFVSPQNLTPLSSSTSSHSSMLHKISDIHPQTYAYSTSQSFFYENKHKTALTNTKAKALEQNSQETLILSNDSTLSVG
ncbi:MAG TPA: hypothetical protein VHE99_00305 [Gammaproteobacteria bacterium]|nr:hypothetical protein [Gammaproteobacteria bacterium]